MCIPKCSRHVAPCASTRTTEYIECDRQPCTNMEAEPAGASDCAELLLRARSFYQEHLPGSRSLTRPSYTLPMHQRALSAIHRPCDDYDLVCTRTNRQLRVVEHIHSQWPQRFCALAHFRASSTSLHHYQSPHAWIEPCKYEPCAAMRQY